MYVIENFEVHQNRAEVFETLVVLTKYCPEITLIYRDGRRSEDAFKNTIELISTISYEKIKYSGEWLVYLTLARDKKLVFALFIINCNLLESRSAAYLCLYLMHQKH